MADARVGESISETITLLDFQTPRQPVRGATFTVDVARDPQGNPFTPVFIEVGDGVYTVTAGPFTKAGSWYVLFHSDDATAQSFEGTWQVAPPTLGGISRGELRRMIGQQTGDLLLATASATGDVNQAISAGTFTREPNAYQGREVLFTGGTPVNLGLTRIVQGSDPISRSITLADALPAAVALGDTMELYNQRGMGWHVADIHEAINNAIRIAGEQHATVPVTVDATDPFARSAPELVIPADFVYFEGLDYLDRQGRRRLVPAKDVRVDRFTHTVEVRGDSAYRLNGLTVRFQGHAKPSILTSDDDTTTIPADWIVEECVATLLGQDVASGYTTQGRSQLYAADSRAADGKRTIIMTRYGPNCVRLR